MKVNGFFITFFEALENVNTFCKKIEIFLKDCSTDFQKRGI